MDEELNDVIEELEVWHRVRGGINRRPSQKHPMQMDTLPRTIALLKKLRAERGVLAAPNNH